MVILEIVIAEDGAVRDVKALKSPAARLAKAAMEAVKQWKYKPTLNSKGKPLAVKATVTINFKLS